MSTLTRPIAAAPARPPAREVWLRWTAVTTLGEFAGFTAPAVAGAAGWALGAPELAFAALMIVAGAVEGATLGFAQSLVLRRYIGGFSSRDWLRATALGAAVAWTLGMIPGTFWDDLEGLAAALFAVVLVALGTALLLSLPAAQWLVLRRYVSNAGWWLPANALAWAAGVSIVMAAMVPVTEDTPAPVVAAVAAASGLLMGLTAAAVTGLALVRLLRARTGAERAA